MKIAYFGSDLFLACLRVFTKHGHKVDTVFTAGEKPDHTALEHFARERDIRCVHHRVTENDMNLLVARGIDCIIVNQYDTIVPQPSDKIISLNIHPTLLPHGRGATPLHHLILNYPQFAGITLHKLTDRLDCGDIVLQTPLSLDQNESLESLIVKLDFRIATLLDEFFADWKTLYLKARTQGEGSHWRKIRLQDRLINWQSNGQELDRLVRAFGRFGVIACDADECWLVNHLEIHAAQLQVQPGIILREDSKTRCIAITDGYVIVYKDSILESMPIDSIAKQ